MRRGALVVPLVVAAAVVVAVALTGGLLTEIGPWYKALKKPSWQPPDWLFGPAWTLIFALIAVSVAVAWRDARSNGERAAILALFIVNALLNIAWSLLFFAWRRPDWSVVEVVLLWLSIVGLMVRVWPVNRLAALLLAPYLAWVSFAAVLNWAVVRLNGFW
jgi:tryptophan-rich sensory protein